MSHVQNLQHAVMAAKAGNPSLARVHLQKAAEEAPADPAVWLWMGWLSESPVSMVQCLEAALHDERHHNIAQAGLAFARALNAYQVAPLASEEPSQRPAHTASPGQAPPGQALPGQAPPGDFPRGQSCVEQSSGTEGPVDLVEQLAASVAEVQHESQTGVDDWSVSEQKTPPADEWDPNGLTPPPLPPEARQPAPVQRDREPPVVDTAFVPSPAADLGQQPVLPHVPRAEPASSSPPATSHVAESAPQSRPTSGTVGPAPVWRAASSDWFTVESRGCSSCHEPPQPFATPAVTPPVSKPPQPPSPAAWSHASGSESENAPSIQPETPGFTADSAVEAVAAAKAASIGPSAADQLDAELERRHVSVTDELESIGEPATVTRSEPVSPASPTDSPVDRTPAEPWRPAGLNDRALPPYESPAVKTTDVSSAGSEISSAASQVAGHSGPTFEGEPLKPATHPRTVLVVDDSPTVRKLVAMTLEKNGYRVVSAYDGVAAIREIAEHNPALILMDVNMPRMDGYQLCKLVRKHEATRHIPVLMLSGKDGVFDRLRGKMVGCSGYVPKPFVPEELVQAVGEHIGAVVR